MESVETPRDRVRAARQFWDAHAEALFPQSTISAVTDLSGAFFERARWEGRGPKFIKLGRLVRYRKQDVVAWIDQRPPVASTYELLQPVIGAPRKARLNPAQPRAKPATKSNARRAPERPRPA